MKKQKFVIIDSNAILHRAWHALPPLATKDGRLVNAVYGFLMIFVKMLKDIKPDYIAATFDTKAKTARHEKFAEYKAGRIKQPDELYDQIPILKDALKTFGISIYEKDGYEADDLIGAIAKQTKKNSDLETIILSGDMDISQLVARGVKLYALKRGVSEIKIYDEKAVYEKFGVTPVQVVDYKALAGDASDNIPGVRGIGPKSASELLQKYHNLDKIYLEAQKEKSQIKQRQRELLLKYKKEAYLSKDLAKILTDISFEFKQSDCRYLGFNREKVFQKLSELEFKNLLKQISFLEKENAVSGQTQLFSVPEKKQQKNHNYQLIENDKSFNKFFSELEKQKFFVFDTETTGLDIIESKLLGISFSWKAGEGYYVINKKKYLEKLKPVFSDYKIKKGGHNLKFDIEILRGAGFLVSGEEFDSLLAAYLLNPGTRANSLDNLVFTELGYQMTPIEDLIGKKGKDQRNMADIALKKVSDYAAEDADYTFRLIQKIEPELKKEGLFDLFKTMEMPLIKVLADIELWGVKIDPEILDAQNKRISLRIGELEEKIYQEARMRFNINSTVQMKDILFSRLQIASAGIKKGKTGLSTAASELEKLKNAHPIILFILEYRELAKLRSTYLDALPKLIKKTGRVHTSFNQTITATGRLSSNDPNLQNIPIKGEMGREIRTSFIAEKECKLIAADYSQIELRIAAHLADDKKMIAAFCAGADIHTMTAAEIHKVSPEEVTKDMRRKAKEINFGVLYGMGAWGVALRTEISREEAQIFVDHYFASFPKIKEYTERMKDFARKKGYAKTLFGRKRNLPDIHSGMGQLKSAAERMAVNMPIQGSSADIIKLAMIKIHLIIKEKYADKVKMILQVHDELVFEAPEKLVGEVSKMVKKEMEEIVKLKVPIIVDVNVGDNWGEMEKIN